ncbi:MAG: hypothetical protein LBG43_10665 [Treponema sp.]|jgi:hypothetical protein|nr:hypothetical protein [Treponema sp.]
MNMLMDFFERANGFSVLTADEMFFVNGGSGIYIALGGCDAFGDGDIVRAVEQEINDAKAAAQKVKAYNDQGYYDYSQGGNPHK